jgi:hypothetical protein
MAPNASPCPQETIIRIYILFNLYIFELIYDNCHGMGQLFYLERWVCKIWDQVADVPGVRRASAIEGLDPERRQGAMQPGA